jgi:quercetin dioxygenase-like cupin family protein
VTLDIRRISIGSEAGGEARVDIAGAIEATTTAALGGTEVFQIWGSDSTPILGPGEQDVSFSPYFPEPGGIRFVLVTMPPENAPPPAVEIDPQEALAEAERLFPGVIEAMTPDEHGRHRTDTVDVNLILDGELWLELDDGSETLLTPGYCVVQRGANHAWHNRTDRPVLMASVLIGAHRSA